MVSKFYTKKVDVYKAVKEQLNNAIVGEEYVKVIATQVLDSIEKTEPFCAYLNVENSPEYLDTLYERRTYDKDVYVGNNLYTKEVVESREVVFCANIIANKPYVQIGKLSGKGSASYILNNRSLEFSSGEVIVKKDIYSAIVEDVCFIKIVDSKALIVVVKEHREEFISNKTDVANSNNITRYEIYIKQDSFPTVKF